jgi:hypothetical protein
MHRSGLYACARDLLIDEGRSTLRGMRSLGWVLIFLDRETREGAQDVHCPDQHHAYRNHKHDPESTHRAVGLAIRRCSGASIRHFVSRLESMRAGPAMFRVSREQPHDVCPQFTDLMNWWLRPRLIAGPASSDWRGPIPLPARHPGGLFSLKKALLHGFPHARARPFFAEDALGNFKEQVANRWPMLRSL